MWYIVTSIFTDCYRVTRFSETSPSDVRAVLTRKCCSASYSKTGHQNGQDSQKVVADDNNHLTDGEGPNKLNQEWCDSDAIMAVTSWQAVSLRQTDRSRQTSGPAALRVSKQKDKGSDWQLDTVEDDRQMQQILAIYIWGFDSMCGELWQSNPSDINKNSTYFWWCSHKKCTVASNTGAY